jgi:hypothetical protein
MAQIQWKQISPHLSGSGNLTGSLNLFGDQTVSGDVNVGGTITAQEFKTELISASILFESGSSLFGNSADDTHVFTGSVNITGSLFIENLDLYEAAIFRKTGSKWATTNDLDITGSLNLELDGVEKYFSVNINGVSQVKVNEEGVLTMTAKVETPTAVTGGLFYSSSNEYYLGFI